MMTLLDVNNHKETALGSLPSEWDILRLGEVAEYINGYAFKPEQWEKSGRPIIRIQNLTGSSDSVNYFSGELDRRYFITDGDLLISWSASLDAFIWKGGEAWLNQHIFKVDNNDICDKYFLYFALKHIIESIRAKTRGSTMKHITRKEFVATEIPLPPLPEQRAIAHVLSTVRQAIEATERVIAAARELKRSLMKYLFTYGPVPIDQADQVPLKQTEIGEVPEGWEVVELSEVVSFTIKPINFKLSSVKKIPFIPMDAIPVDGRYPEYFIEKSPSEISSGVYAELGDILLAKITPSFEHGKQAIVANIPTDFAYATTEVYPLRPFCDMYLDKLFLFHYLRVPKVRTSIAGKMEGSTGRQRVPKAVVQNTLLPIPNISHQFEIVKAFDCLDNKVQIETRRKSALEALFNSLLYHLMTGKVRVAPIESE